MGKTCSVFLGIVQDSEVIYTTVYTPHLCSDHSWRHVPVSLAASPKPQPALLHLTQWHRVCIKASSGQGTCSSPAVAVGGLRMQRAVSLAGQGRAELGKILCTRVTFVVEPSHRVKCYTDVCLLSGQAGCAERMGVLVGLCQTWTKARVSSSSLTKYLSGLESLGRLVTCWYLLMTLWHCLKSKDN